MSAAITTTEVTYEQDVVYARQRARLIAEELGFDKQDQTRISTAVSEIVRNAFQYAGGGTVDFAVEGEQARSLEVTVRDHGPGIAELDDILEGRFRSPTGMGMGIVGVRRLMDRFHVESRPQEGTTVSLGKALPESAPPVTPAVLRRLADRLTSASMASPLDEQRLQNQELMHALESLKTRQEELELLNRELEDTNRGVVALYAELDEKATQLAHAHDLKARFLSNMSHEFRTPLNSILALSQLLLDRVDGDLSEEQEKQVSFIRQATRDLGELVNDLLDMAKIGAGRVPVNPREFTVEEVFSGLRGMFKPTLATEDLELVFEDPQGIPEMYTDDGKLSQILRNFLSNALKFTEEGEVRVSAQLDDDTRSVVFAVADSGVGIAAADMELIFEEYAQVDAAQTKRKAGTGLGLPISRNLAVLLDGWVWAESTPGIGSTFYAQLPVRYGESTVTPDTVRPIVEVDATRLQVLVVEDDEATQLLYDKYLKGSGYQTLPARSIAQARQILSRVQPVAIVLDILLPGEDSWAFLAELHTNPVTSQTPVIVASVVDDIDKGLALGAVDYCVKPVERSWLLERLRTLREAPGGPTLDQVLVIDDDQVARYILKGFLADTKCTLIEATDGEQGLFMARRERPGLIVLDLVMPGMSGFEVLTELKADTATADIPVIVSTSKTLAQAETDELRRHALDVISKESLSREMIVRKVCQALRQAAEPESGG